MTPMFKSRSRGLKTKDTVLIPSHYLTKLLIGYLKCSISTLIMIVVSTKLFYCLYSATGQECFTCLY